MIQSIIPILLSIHLLICLFLIGAILVQRSEGGGALGMGGGPTSMMSGRSATTFITRATTDGLPTKSIDLSVPKAPVNAVVPEPVTGGIPASSATAPVAPLFPPAANTEPKADEKAPAEKK